MRTISRRLLTAMQVAESGETGNYMMTRKRWCAKMSIFLRPRFHTSVFGFNTSLPGFHTLLSRLHTLCLPPGSRASSQSDRLRHHHVLVYWLVSPSVSSVWGIACWAASLNSVSSLWILSRSLWLSSSSVDIYEDCVVSWACKPLSSPVVSSSFTKRNPLTRSSTSLLGAKASSLSGRPRGRSFAGTMSPCIDPKQSIVGSAAVPSTVNVFSVPGVSTLESEHRFVAGERKAE
mmetsp:Transcript_11953/g.20189  ORF Transcript_11953/g.20189 Transcript_11953/m.20189 type:complete len:233 (+) Transcript_11953:796-1494(+)